VPALKTIFIKRTPHDRGVYFHGRIWNLMIFAEKFSVSIDKAFKACYSITVS